MPKFLMNGLFPSVAIAFYTALAMVMSSGVATADFIVINFTTTLINIGFLCYVIKVIAYMQNVYVRQLGWLIIATICVVLGVYHALVTMLVFQTNMSLISGAYIYILEAAALLIVAVDNRFVK